VAGVGPAPRRPPTRPTPTSSPLLDEVSLPDVVGCGVNQPAPDSWSPARAAATVWTWAPGVPSDPPPPPSGRGESWWDWLERVRRWIAGQRGLCGFLDPADARWRARPCSDAVVTACRNDTGPVPVPVAPWTLGYGKRGVCPPGTVFAPPLTPPDAAALAAAVAVGGHDGAWLPVKGPGWAVEVSSGGGGEVVGGRGVGGGAPRVAVSRRL